MIDLGSIPDWINVLIALLAFIGFLIVERDRLPLTKSNSSKPTSMSKPAFPTGNIQGQSSSNEENSIAFRAKLYSLILIGIVLGLALVPINTLAVSSSIGKDWDTIHSAQNAASFMSAIILSSLFSAAYLPLSTSLAVTFVHWAERVFISFALLWLIHDSVIVSRDYVNYMFVVSKLEYDVTASVILSTVMLLLIGFYSTPIDWIIGLWRNWKRKRLER